MSNFILDSVSRYSMNYLVEIYNSIEEERDECRFKNNRS
jgi:hypothetical protein